MGTSGPPPLVSLRDRFAGTALRLIAGLLLAVSGSPASTAEQSAQQAVIIVHHAIDTARVTRRELRRMYLGKRGHWDDDQRVVLALHADDPAAEARLQAIVGKTPKQFASYWRRRVFTGKGRMPRSFASAAELRAYVGATPGALACIGSAEDVSDDASVTVLAVGEAENEETEE